MTRRNLDLVRSARRETVIAQARAAARRAERRRRQVRVLRAAC